MGLGERVKAAWSVLAAERKTVAEPVAALGGPVALGGFRPGARGAVAALPKPTAANLRRLAETPAVRRAINCIKDRVAAMEWRVEATPDAGAEGSEERGERCRRLARALREPNAADSFRTLLEQVIEDLLVGGAGAVEIDTDGERLVRLWPVDAMSVQVNAEWDGEEETPRFAQVTGRSGRAATVPLLDRELMYVRLNARTHTPFGLGKVEVAFQAVNELLAAGRYAARVAANGVAQYALWMEGRTPEQQARLVGWWKDEVEGSGSVPVMSSESKPEVLRFTAGTDAELRINWQEFLLRMIANAFDLPAMMLGVSHDVNRSTAGELADDAFQSAVVPLAKLLAEHVTRDVIGKALGWSDVRFVFSDLESRDEETEVEIQTKLLAAGVLTVDEVRAKRGMGPMPSSS